MVRTRGAATVLGVSITAIKRAATTRRMEITPSTEHVKAIRRGILSGLYDTWTVLTIGGRRGYDTEQSEVSLS